MNKSELKTLLDNESLNDEQFEQEINKLIGVDGFKSTIAELNEKVASFDSAKEVINQKIESIKGKSILTDKELELSILTEAKRNNAVSPSQTVILTKNAFVKEDGKFIHTTKDGKKQTVQEYIKSFLSDESNNHLVLSSVKNGIGGMKRDEKKLKTSYSKDVVQFAEEHNLSPKAAKQIVELKSKKLKSRR